MTVRNLRRCVVLLVIWAGMVPALAEDVEKKFRLGFSLGGYNTTDEVPSDAANVLSLVDENRLLVNLFADPRDDSAAFGRLGIDSGPIVKVFGQYAISKIFMIEASVGYQEADVGDVEVQAQFIGIDVPETQFFNFTTYRVPVGEMTRVPLQVTAMARFRPRASFNPYIGGGIGYAFIGFEPSEEFDELSLNMDSSQGGQMRLTSSFNGVPQLLGGTANVVDLQGATVDARDTFEWHIAGGAEISFKRKWVVFLDLRWVFASRSMTVGFNGGNYLGVPVPQLVDFESSGLANGTYGAVRIDNGGLIDGGRLAWVPRENEPVSTVCVDPNTGNINTQQCRQQFQLGDTDGNPDSAFYYAQGGEIDYGGVGVTIGVRYTF